MGCCKLTQPLASKIYREKWWKLTPPKTYFHLHFIYHRTEMEDKYWKRCILHSVQERNGKYCSTKSMKWMSQRDLCVHGYSLKVQQWSSTPNGIHSHSLHSEVQSALYKAPCQWNSLGQLHVFLFFFLGMYHTLWSFINELVGCLHHKTCLSMARAQ